MIRLYGKLFSRAQYCAWVLEEAGVEYEHIPIDQHAGENKTPEYLAINPNGKVPALDDDGLILFESQAINLHLARKYAPHLMPGDAVDQSYVLQWSFWAATEVEPRLTVLFRESVMKKDGADQAAVETATSEFHQRLKVLESHLEGRDYLIGNDFTIADLNVAGVLSGGDMLGIKLDEYPQVVAWRARCDSRPARQKILSLMRPA